jgi:cell wall-associated NlpC family hydrolase
MPRFDPRITPARPDLAASHLRGQVDAPRYVEGTVQQVVAGQTPVRNEPHHGATMITEALHGDRVTIYETDDEGWAWGQLSSDGYVGWIPASALLAPGPQPTHKVTALRTLVFPGASIKQPPADALPLGSLVTVVREAATFGITPSGGHIPKRHLSPLDAVEPDFVAVAERFLGVPYLWGGKTSLGLDCSGLVQVSLTACGIACPRDSDMQEAAIGRSTPLSELWRGDLVFWKGHVAIARDNTTIIHANAHHMMVAIEPAAEAIARIRATGSEVSLVKRVS